MQFGSVGTDGRTVALQKLATLSLGADAALPQCCVAQHVPDRHPGRLQTAEKLDPGQDRCVVIPMARLVAVSIGQQPDPLIVTNRMCCQSRAFRQFTNLHEHPSRSTTQRKLRVRAHSKSRGNRSTVIRAPGSNGCAVIVIATTGHCRRVAQRRISRRAHLLWHGGHADLTRAFARSGRFAHPTQAAGEQVRCITVIASVSEAIHRAAKSKDGLLRRKGSSQ